MSKIDEEFCWESALECRCQEYKECLEDGKEDTNYAQELRDDICDCALAVQFGYDWYDKID